MASAGIYSSKTHFFYFHGTVATRPVVYHTLKFAWSHSQVDPKSRFLLGYKRGYSSSSFSNFTTVVSLFGKFPKTSGLSFDYVMKQDLRSELHVQTGFGQDFLRENQIYVKTFLSRSQDRYEYLNALPEAEECHQQMKLGSYQLPICANLTDEAGLLDKIRVQVNYDNLSSKARNFTHKVYGFAKKLFYFNMEENKVDPHGTTGPKEIRFDGQFSPDLEGFNVTLRTQDMVSEFYDVPVNTWLKPVVVFHPSVPVYHRVAGRVFEFGTFLRKY